MIAENVPALNGSTGRAQGGKFAIGNKIAKGNPIARRTHAIRRELTKAVKPEDVRQIVAALVAQAKAGDVAAAKELFDRTLGKAPQAIAVQAQIDAQIAADRSAFFHPLMDGNFRLWVEERVADGEVTMADLAAECFEPAYIEFLAWAAENDVDAAKPEIGVMRGPPQLFDPEYADYLRKKALGEDTIRVEFADDWYGSKAANRAASNGQPH